MEPRRINTRSRSQQAAIKEVSERRKICGLPARTRSQQAATKELVERRKTRWRPPRMRSQQAATKELGARRKTRWLLARINVRNRVSKDANLGVVNEEDDDDHDDDEIKVVDESEYLRRMAALKGDSAKQNTSVEGNQNLGKDDDCEHANDNDGNIELEVDNGNNKEHIVCHDDNKEHGVGADKEHEVVHGDNKPDIVGHDDTTEVEVGHNDNKEVEVGLDDNKGIAVGHDDNKEPKVGHDDAIEREIDRDDNKEREVSHADIAKGAMSDEGSDDSLLILRETWHSDSDGSHSSVSSSDSDSETMCTPRRAEVQVGCSRGIRSRSSEEISEKDGCNGVCREANNVFVGNSDSNGLKGKLEQTEKQSEPVFNGGVFGKRKYDGLVLTVKPENNAPEDDFVGRRTRSHRRPKMRREKKGDGTFSHPVAIDDESDSSSDGGYEVKKTFYYGNMSCGNGRVRRRGRPSKRAYVEANSESDTDSELDIKPDIDPMPMTNSIPENNSKPDIDPMPVINLMPGNDTKLESNCIPVPVSMISPVPENNSKLKSDFRPVPEPVNPMPENKSKFGNGFKPAHVPVINPMPGNNSKLKNGFKPAYVPLINPMPENNSKLTNGFKHANVPVINPMSEKPKNDPKPVDKTVCEEVIKRKRGRPPKNSIGDRHLWPKKKKRTLDMSNEVENNLLSSILENGNVGVEETPVAFTSEAFLQLKFKFCAQNSLPDMCEEEDEIEDLFTDLDFALRTCDVGCSTSSLDEFGEGDDDLVSYSSAVVQAKLCSEGKHYFIVDDEIGLMCKFCSFVKLDIRNIVPAFDDNPFGGSGKNKYPWRYYDEYLAAVSKGSDLSEFQHNRDHFLSDNTEGTVWDLVPGVKKSLYPHQQEAFEFIWKNVGGTTTLDEVGKQTKIRIGGCIICHAPGTGKTRLAITFLQSFLRKFPASCPVIIAPTSMLLTWEEEFTRWKVDVPFHNLNKTELSGREDREIVKRSGNIRNIRNLRNAKLCSWAAGKGILGISYRLFEELAGERKGVDGSVKQALLEQPGIIILDEGHTPRNNDSNIYNVLIKVKTKRRIILSGTPFQNNFQELHNTLSLVRQEFRNPHLLGGYLNDDSRIVELRKWMKPHVHVHKGEILKKTLRGLYHSVLFLKPSDLQKQCCQQLSAVKCIMEYNHLVSVACVHPSLLALCKQIPENMDKGLLTQCKENIEFGLKIKFLLELINLAVGEKVLVFNQYILPLDFIAGLLKTRYHWTEGKEFLYMRGQQDTKQRQSSINLFNDPSSKVRVLLASTKACGEGIHLIGASRVVLLDVVWNPSVERQAISRAYRIGQKKDVFVYRLILSGTLEEKKYHRLMTKDRLSELVFSTEGEKCQMTSMVSPIPEDRILEVMIQNEKTNSMFSKIIKSKAADELIKSFNPLK